MNNFQEPETIRVEEMSFTCLNFSRSESLSGTPIEKK